MTEEKRSSYIDEANALDTEKLVEVLGIKLKHYTQGYELIREYVEKSCELREEIDVLREQLKERLTETE